MDNDPAEHFTLYTLHFRHRRLLEAPIVFKVILVALLLVIIASLFSALYVLLRDPDSSTRVVKMLAVRVGLSLFVMGLLFLGSLLGWVQPHGFGG